LALSDWMGVSLPECFTRRDFVFGYVYELVFGGLQQFPFSNFSNPPFVPKRRRPLLLDWSACAALWLALVDPSVPPLAFQLFPKLCAVFDFDSPLGQFEGLTDTNTGPSFFISVNGLNPRFLSSSRSANIVPFPLPVFALSFRPSQMIWRGVPVVLLWVSPPLIFSLIVSFFVRRYSVDNL